MSGILISAIQITRKLPGSYQEVTRKLPVSAKRTAPKISLNVCVWSTLLTALVFVVLARSMAEATTHSLRKEGTWAREPVSHELLNRLKEDAYLGGLVLLGCTQWTSQQRRGWNIPHQTYYLLVDSYYLLLTTCYLLLATYYVLLTTCYLYLLLTTYYSLLTTYYLLIATYYLLLTTCYLLLTAYYLLINGYYLLLTTCYLLFATHYLLLTT